MKYPKSLKIGDTIGICAPSAGINKPEKQIRLDEAINRFWQKVETGKDQMWVLGVWKKSEQILKID